MICIENSPRREQARPEAFVAIHDPAETGPNLPRRDVWTGEAPCLLQLVGMT